MSTIKAGKIQPPNDSDPLQIFTNAVERMTVTSGGLVGIGTATPTVALDVVGGIKASTTLTIAESEVFTTQRTFTQSFNAVGSGTSGHTVVGDVWLIGSFSDPSIGPAQFKFVHNSHTESNLQSDLYEWSRHYGADVPATTNIFSDWVELPVSISVTYQATRSFRFDVRKKQQGEMELRMRATSSGPFGQGNHHFTFTTTGSAIYTPAASGTATPAQSAPTGFHGRQSYEFPVSKGGYGFAGSTAGVFILNNGNVGVGIIAPTVALDVAGPNARIWVRPSSGGGLDSSAGAGLKIEYVSADNSAKLQAYDYATSTAKNISLNSSGGDVIIDNNLKLGNSSLATTGYTKLPNGIMMQWGATAIAGVHGSLYTITYPIAFTTFWTNTFVVQNNVLSTVTTVQYLHGKTTTTPNSNFIVQSGTVNGGAYACTVRWFAIGLA